MGPCALFVSGAGDEARTRDPLLGNYPDAMQAANESVEAARSMLLLQLGGRESRRLGGRLRNRSSGEMLTLAARANKQAIADIKH